MQLSHPEKAISGMLTTAQRTEW